MMLEIEVFMLKYVFCIILDCYSSPGELDLAMASWESVLSGVVRHGEKIARHGEKTACQVKLTAQHVLSTRFVASKGYPRRVLAVSY
jgi:hypothetical protein